MTDLSMLLRKLDAFQYAIYVVGMSAVTTEFPGPVREHIDVLHQEIEEVTAEIKKHLPRKISHQ